LVELFLAIILGPLVAGCGQLLGNDLIGPSKAINERLDEERKALRRPDLVTRFWTFYFLWKPRFSFQEPEVNGRSGPQTPLRP
jgi:hypothetical protein